MLLLFFGPIAYLAAFDLGSQYIKVAKVSSAADGSPEVLENGRGSVITPSAVAFKTDAYRDSHITNEDLQTTKVMFGDDALPILKRNSMAGSDSVTGIIGRNFSTRFNIPKIANAKEMLSLLMKDMFRKMGVTGIVAVIPYFYTMEQRNAVMAAAWGASIDYYGFVDDCQAVAYSWFTRFFNASATPRNVLFVDVGATTTKAYRIRFRGMKPNMSSYEFTEKSGGWFMSKKIAEAKNISVRKAQKELASEDFVDSYLIRDELDEIKATVKRAMTAPIHVVEIFGGASKFPVVKAAIESVVEELEVRRSLPAYETVAHGAVYAFQDILGDKDGFMLNMSRCSPYDVYVVCNQSRDDYCIRSRSCEEGVLMEDAICRELFIRAPLEQVPEGVGDLLGHYELLNMTKFFKSKHMSSGYVMLKMPYPVIESVMWCSNDGIKCFPIEARSAHEADDIEYDRVREMVDTVEEAHTKFLKLDNAKNLVRDGIQWLSEHEPVGGRILISRANEMLETNKDPVALEQMAKKLKAARREL